MPRVGRETEIEVGVHGVATLVLEGIGLELGHQADPPALVPAQVDDDAATGGDDALEGLVELRAAVAALRAEDVAGQALGVHPDQHRLSFAGRASVVGRACRHHVAVHEREVLGGVDGRPEAVGPELTVPGRQPGLGHPLDQGLGAVPVAHQVVDRDHRQPVLVGEGPQLGCALHGAVVVDHLDQHAGRGEAGEAGQVDGSLRVAPARQHAALAVAEREDVTGPGELPRLGGRVGEHPGRVGPVAGADPGGHAVARVDRDRVRRTHLVAVVRRHQRDLETVEHRGRHRNADDPAGVPDREGHQGGGRLGRREDEVALVLALLVVDDDDRLAGRDVGQGTLDAVQWDGHDISPAISWVSRVFHEVGVLLGSAGAQPDHEAPDDEAAVRRRRGSRSGSSGCATAGVRRPGRRRSRPARSRSSRAPSRRSRPSSRRRSRRRTSSTSAGRDSRHRSRENSHWHTRTPATQTPR